MLTLTEKEEDILVSSVKDCSSELLLIESQVLQKLITETLNVIKTCLDVLL